MIVLITETATDKRGVKTLVTSHGIDNRTGVVVIMPNVHPEENGATFNEFVGEWVIKD